MPSRVVNNGRWQGLVDEAVAVDMLARSAKHAATQLKYCRGQYHGPIILFDPLYHEPQIYHRMILILTWASMLSVHLCGRFIEPAHHRKGFALP